MTAAMRWTPAIHDEYKRRRARQLAQTEQLDREFAEMGATINAVPADLRASNGRDGYGARSPSAGAAPSSRHLSFIVPMPPTVNQLYGIGSGGIKFLLPEQRAFRQSVTHIVGGVMAGSDDSALRGRLEMRVTLYFGNRRRTDISNRIKALEDALTHAGAYQDDSQIDRVIVERIVIPGAESCAVTLAEI